MEANHLETFTTCMDQGVDANGIPFAVMAVALMK